MVPTRSGIVNFSVATSAQSTDRCAPLAHLALDPRPHRRSRKSQVCDLLYRAHPVSPMNQDWLGTARPSSPLRVCPRMNPRLQRGGARCHQKTTSRLWTEGLQGRVMRSPGSHPYRGRSSGRTRRCCSIPEREDYESPRRELS